jgi:2-oxoisovalerate dehydrogenase E2 component (dihydrolipoyl transacylase)
LIVPVVRGADQLDIWQLDQAIAARVEEARSGKIDAENLRGATITLTSLGKLGGIAATPVVMPPQVCILGPNKIAERPVIKDGAVSARKIMNLSISCDHRIIDGHDAASFVQALKLRLETPALIFLPAQN